MNMSDLKENLLYLVFLVVIVAASTSSCEKEVSSLVVDPNHKVKPEYNTPFKLSISQRAFFRKDELTVQFLGVTEDSRCPQGATCIWQGEVKVSLSLATENQQSDEITLVLGTQPDQAKQVFDGFLVELEKVTPVPVEGKEMDADDYKITLRVIRMDTSCTPIVIDQEKAASASSDPFDFKSVSVEGDCLQIEVSYGGGCDGADFELITGGEVMESYPPQMRIALLLDDQDDCKALVTKNLSYDISALRQQNSEVILHLTDWDTPISFK